MIFRKRQVACVIYPLTDVRVAKRLETDVGPSNTPLAANSVAFANGRVVALASNGGNRSPLNRLEAIMATIAAYLISLSIIGFGLWIFALEEIQPASMLVGVGLMPVAVGLASLANEIYNDLYS
jgi:hypothetical protein